MVLPLVPIFQEDYDAGKPNSLLEPRRPPEPPNDRNKAREICQVLPFGMFHLFSVKR